MKNTSQHSFHIPVLGLSYSIDTPIKVAPFGISSVISIMDDELIESMRSYHCSQNDLEFTHINKKEEDYRTKRITNYLNIVKQIIDSQVGKIKKMPFVEGNSLWQYFELLPQESALSKLFHQMLKENDTAKKEKLQNELRESVTAGDIDVNIMAKVDKQNYTKEGVSLPDEYSDALSALRGFAKSNLTSSVIFSAGYNPRLYNYAENFEDFFPDENNYLKKKIILKVSDYRSALIQGKILAKKGLWVSEFRIESGLNCGGHVFATDGILMGPILEEFKQNRHKLYQELLILCNENLQTSNKNIFIKNPIQKITAQGGIGTADEHAYLLSYYQLDSIGWGSPFLLVPEATNVDEITLNQLSTASKEDYYLSNASPLGVLFNNFRKSTAEIQRKERIAKGRAGSPCYKKLLSNNTEFTEKPICTASRQYIDLKTKQINSLDISDEQKQIQITNVEERDCLCEGLSASALIKTKMPLSHKLSAVTICPGPNLAYFSGIFSLKDMISHIYGLKNINNKIERPHVFINELELYIKYLQKQVQAYGESINEKQQKYFTKFKQNLQVGIDYYKKMVENFSNVQYNTLQLSKLEVQLSNI
ncbi:MAG: hypothetical protein KF781_05865 [Chitinophagaceae bacterium]|nr:hypothetical protein [Chitinophagaceae bacterium]MCW5906078.1 hypothetical protein [Chitinophagaceae bacterium]